MLEENDNYLEYAKIHKNEFISDIITGKSVSSDRTAVFMAGSHGSGKSEISSSISSMYPDYVIIDADYFRSKFPGYNGQNSSQFQKASSWLVEQAFLYMIDHGYSFILDVTFALISSNSNIKRVIKKDYKPIIFYVYQEPLVAWDFTKRREKLEGRIVPKKTFINAFFKSKENIKKAKSKFPEVELNIVLKDFDNNIADVHFDADNVELIVSDKYTHKELEDKINDWTRKS